MLNFYQKKKKIDFRSILFYANLLVFVGCVAYLGNYYYTGMKSEGKVDSIRQLAEEKGIDTTIVDKEAQVDSNGNLVIMDKYKVLLKEYPDIVGWIKVESVEGVKESPIDYPIMQTIDDPEFYLDKDVNGEYSREGTPFLDYRCDITKPTDNFIIYAHNMANHHQFGSLKLFRSKSYYEEHPTIKVETLYSAGTYEIVAAFYSQRYNKDDDVFKYYKFTDAKNKKEFDDFIKGIKDLALYDTGVEATYGDQLITLSTCNYDIKSVPKGDGRFVVVARLKKSDETTDNVIGDKNMDDKKYHTDGRTKKTDEPEESVDPENPEESLEPEETPTETPVPESAKPDESKKPKESTKPVVTSKPETGDNTTDKVPGGISVDDSKPDKSAKPVTPPVVVENPDKTGKPATKEPTTKTPKTEKTLPTAAPTGAPTVAPDDPENPQATESAEPIETPEPTQEPTPEPDNPELPDEGNNEE